MTRRHHEVLLLPGGPLCGVFTLEEAGCCCRFLRNPGFELVVLFDLDPADSSLFVRVTVVTLQMFGVLVTVRNNLKMS